MAGAPSTGRRPRRVMLSRMFLATRIADVDAFAYFVILGLVVLAAIIVGRRLP